MTMADGGGMSENGSVGQSSGASSGSGTGNGRTDRDPLLTLKQAAAMFQVAPSTVGNWIQDGKIQYVRLPSGMPKIRRSVVLRALEEVRG